LISRIGKTLVASSMVVSTAIKRNCSCDSSSTPNRPHQLLITLNSSLNLSISSRPIPKPQTPCSILCVSLTAFVLTLKQLC
jgi:hypothetical protein